MNKSELIGMLEGAVNKAAQDYVANIDRTVKTLIEQSVLSLLGLARNGYSGVAIDHCNGRNSILTNVIEQRAKEQVEKIVAGFKLDANDKEVRAAFEKEFKEQLNLRIKWHANEISKSIAAQIVKKYTDKELEKLGFEPDPKAKQECRY